VKTLAGCCIDDTNLFLCLGVNPCLLKGKRVGVFVGACFSETEKFWYYDKPHENGYGLTGCVRAMYANQISYWLGITGKLLFTPNTAFISNLLPLLKGLKFRHFHNNFSIFLCVCKS